VVRVASIFALGLLLSLAMGCGQLLNVRGDDCIEMPTDKGLIFTACGSERWQLEGRRGELWGYADMLLDGFDFVLLENGMQPMTGFAAGTQVSLTGNVPGYSGHYYYGENLIELHGHGKKPWWSSALGHELWHLYEDRALGLGRWEWAALNESGQHFLMGDFAYQIQGQAKWYVLENHPDPPDSP
jgi:hypothetical protein